MYIYTYIYIIPADRHFAQREHDFNTDAKVTIIEKLQNTKLSKESITELLKKSVRTFR